MDKKNKHIEQLSPELIQAYHSGTLTSSEMHQVELLMLERPLYNEGMDGLESLSSEDLSLDMDALYARVDDTIKEEKTGFWTVWKKTAAVMLVLITVSGLFYLYQPDALPTKELSEVKKPLGNVASDSIANDDTLSNKSKLKPEPEPSSTIPEKDVAKREELYAKAKEDVDQKLQNIPDLEITKIKIDPARAREALTSKILGLQTVPSPKMSDSPPRPTVQALLDSISTSFAGLVIEPMKIDASKRKIVPDRLKLALDIEKPILEPESNAGEALAGKIAGVRVTPLEEKTNEVYESAKPIDGFPKFRRYLKKNLRYPEAAKAEKVKGTVSVEFHISSTGELSDFRITKGLGAGCDEEAIRLIKEGPKWNPKTVGADKTPVLSVVTVKVKFKS